MSKYLDTMIDFVSTALYYIDKYKISLDKAFQKTLQRMEKRVKGYSLKPFYDILKNIVLNYYKLRYIESQVYGSTKGYKRCVKLWLFFYGDKVIADKKALTKFRKKFSKNIRINVNEFNLNEDMIWVKYSYPTWFTKKLSKYMDRDELCKLLSSLNSEIIWIRVNTLKIDVDKAIKFLEANGVEVERDKDLYYMLRVLRYKKPIYTLDLLREGYIVTQDKASALVVEALRPEPGDVIYDVCAAPGIKTSLIMQLTENKARVIAVDISRNRVKSLRRLLKIYGVDVNRVDIIVGDSRIIATSRRADKVLVDAPCSSSGVISKDPAVKIHLRNQGKVEYYSNAQRSLIMNAINLGELIVYATCSLLPDEGEEVVEPLAEKELIKLIKPQIRCCCGYRGYRFRELFCRTFPHIHGTGGFFISVFKPSMQ